MVCADARKTPPQGVRGVLANRLRTAGPPNFAAQGQSVSRETVADEPLTGLFFRGAPPAPAVAGIIVGRWSRPRDYPWLIQDRRAILDGL
jgi:hypothetical protein